MQHIVSVKLPKGNFYRLFKFNLIVYMCFCLYVHAHNSRGKKMVSDTLELELQATVIHSNLMLGIEPNSSPRAPSTLNC